MSFIIFEYLSLIVQKNEDTYIRILFHCVNILSTVLDFYPLCHQKVYISFQFFMHYSCVQILCLLPIRPHIHLKYLVAKRKKRYKEVFRYQLDKKRMHLASPVLAKNKYIKCTTLHSPTTTSHLNLYTKKKYKSEGITQSHLPD